MYLARPQITTYTIQLIGRWRSDAFLQYIRKQVKQFSACISEAMVVNEDFFAYSRIYMYCFPIKNKDGKGPDTQALNRKIIE